jgi:hypothetical protein
MRQAKLFKADLNVLAIGISLHLTVGARRGLEFLEAHELN